MGLSCSEYIWWEQFTKATTANQSCGTAQRQHQSGKQKRHICVEILCWKHKILAWLFFHIVFFRRQKNKIRLLFKFITDEARRFLRLWIFWTNLKMWMEMQVFVAFEHLHLCLCVCICTTGCSTAIYSTHWICIVCGGVISFSFISGSRFSHQIQRIYANGSNWMCATIGNSH